MLLNSSQAWESAFPGAVVGLLAMRRVINQESHPALDARKTELEQELRAKFAGLDRAALKALPILQAYGAYYRAFKKTYHVQAQIESIVHRGKSIPRVSTLVECMFMAELKNMLLTAGHDLGAVEQPLRLEVSNGCEHYVRPNGKDQVLKPDDMYIADASGILSSIIYGPGLRTRIAPETHEVLFTVYAPTGIGEGPVRQHLSDIQDNVLVCCPDATVEALEMHAA
jgi:DNA/RNA-binding domain of Phe-tRNA-synthetase-like protein